jgi:hypothetical protein
MEDFAYRYVTVIEADSLATTVTHAMRTNPDYNLLGKRDTSVGDIITVEDKMFMIKGDGEFKRVPRTISLYKQIRETDEAIIEILSRKHLTQEDIDELIENCY